MNRRAMLTACALVSAALTQTAFAYSQEEVNVFDEPSVSTMDTRARATPGDEARFDGDVRSTAAPSKPTREAGANQDARRNVDRVQP
ncbi:hypothetical protein [Burkholderia sp. 8Y]|uniref:hypothetical protein n=1 Tax=Burkholderia sp. 8Y TaxID=2653133 RepID=UPI001F166FD1|nr:hypothetical protein [Burkholderia sp. 8Y]